MSTNDVLDRHLAAFDQTHDPTGHPLQLSATQEALDVCSECGRTAPSAWNHSLDCPRFRSHPASIAAQAVSE